MGNVYSPNRAGRTTLAEDRTTPVGTFLTSYEPPRSHAHRRRSAPSAQRVAESPSPNDAVPTPLQHHSRRLYSSEPPPRPQSFNKTFSRPIFKVALMAIFTYQLAYYGWLRLEHNEKRHDLNSRPT
ncbi:hypothetical protein PG993_013954 [Apiospora rasikravindrae]|uniref:Uncharacterized protein n=1 Tax=Apiospora rasikravindrae TaxID=990691 RepID=A0ABR1RTQ7_9PEZI